MLPGVVGEDADDAGSHNGCGDSKDTDKWLKFSNLANNLGLELLLVGGSIAKEELVFFISGQLPLIGEQAKKNGCNRCPDDEQNGYGFHDVHSVPPPCNRADVLRKIRYLRALGCSAGNEPSAQSYAIQWTLKQPFFEGDAGYKERRFLVFGDEVKGKKCDRGDTGDHKCKQNYDEPRGAVGCLGRGLSDPHCFDKDIRDETDEIHSYSMRAESNGSRLALWLGFASLGIRRTSSYYGLAAAGVGAYT
jgi:hypothetical protein